MRLRDAETVGWSAAANRKNPGRPPQRYVCGSTYEDDLSLLDVWERILSFFFHKNTHREPGRRR